MEYVCCVLKNSALEKKNIFLFTSMEYEPQLVIDCVKGIYFEQGNNSICVISCTVMLYRTQ